MVQAYSAAEGAAPPIPPGDAPALRAARTLRSASLSRSALPLLISTTSAPTLLPCLPDPGVTFSLQP